MPGASFELVAGGKPRAAIVAGGGTGDEDSARMLARSVAEITGGVPVVGEGESSPFDNLVHLGTLSDGGGGMEVLRRKRPLASWEDREQESYKRLNIAADLGDEGFVRDATRRDGGGDLVLGGHTGQGTMYAAVTAAQRLCLEGASLSIRHIDSPLQPRINVPLFPNRSIATNIGGPDWIEPARWENE